MRVKNLLKSGMIYQKEEIAVVSPEFSHQQKIHFILLLDGLSVRLAPNQSNRPANERLTKLLMEGALKPDGTIVHPKSFTLSYWLEGLLS